MIKSIRWWSLALFTAVVICVIWFLSIPCWALATSLGKLMEVFERITDWCDKVDERLLSDAGKD